MAGIAADNDTRGQFDKLIFIFESDEWREVWESLNLSVESFETLKLDPKTKDIEVWKVCQKAEVMLVTGNRQGKGADSLEAAIRTLNKADSLPVFTLADSTRVMKSPSYAKRVAESFLDYLEDWNALRGTGRIYLP
jgi:hypothetical protein